MSTKCPQCGEQGVQSDDYDEQMGDSVAVCHNCGIVLSTGRISVEQDWTNGGGNNSAFPTYQSNMPKNMNRLRESSTPCPGYYSSLGRLKCFCSVLGLNPEGRQEAEYLFESTYYQAEFKQLSLSKKQTIAGVCVYIVCRRKDWPITLDHICRIVECKPGEFVTLKQRILTLLDITLTSLTIEDHVKALCESKGFEKDTLEVIGEIIQLCKSVWLVDGRKPEGIVSAAAFLAWKSEDYISRIKKTFKQFCKQFGFVPGSTGAKRLSEMTQILVLLGKEIPWVMPDSVTDKTLVVHLRDIVKYRQTFYESALRKAKEEFESSSDSYAGDSNQGSLKRKTCDDDDDAISPSADSSFQKRQKDFPSATA